MKHKPHLGPIPWAMVAAVVAACQSTAWASQVQLQAQVGWGGWVRYGTWNPVMVDVSAGEEFRGWLVVEVPQEFGAQRVQLRKPVQLAPRGRRRWQFVAWISDPRKPVVVRAVGEDGRVAAEIEVTPSSERAAASVVGYVGDEPPVPPRQVEGGGHRVVAWLSEEDLPDRPPAYASLDLMVLERLDATRMNVDQQEALEIWVLHGGRVVVSGAFEPGPFPWMKVSKEIAGLAPAEDLASVRAEAVRRLLPEPGARPVSERGRTVAVVAAHGLGQVVRWAAPASRVPPTSPLWPLALPGPHPQEGPPEPHVRPRAPLAEAAAWLGAYALLWFFAVRFAGARFTRWLFAAPVLLAAVVVGVPVAADRVRQAASTLAVRGGTVVVEGQAWTRSWGFSSAPYRGPYTYQLPAADALWVSGQFAEATVTFHVDRAILQVFQEAGARLRIWWEDVNSLNPAPTLRWEGEAVRVQNVGMRTDGLVLFRGRMSGLEPAGPELVASRWATLSPGLEATDGLRWLRPDADTIIETRPVAAFPDPRAGGWRFVLGPAP